VKLSREKALSSETSVSRPEPSPAVKPAVLAYGTIKIAGNSIDIRIMRGRQKLDDLGLKLGEDVLIVAAPGEGTLLVRLPKVVTESTMPQILDRIKIAIEKLGESYRYTVMHPRQLREILTRTWTKKVRLIRQPGKKRAAESS